VLFLCYLYLMGLMLHLCYLYCRGSCRTCVICIFIGAHVAFALFVFVREFMSHLCYLYLHRGSCRFVLFVFE
jgi:hypothetical protein